MIKEVLGMRVLGNKLSIKGGRELECLKRME